MHMYATWLALATALAKVASQETECHDYVILSIRGTYEAQGPSIAFPGMINTTLPAVPGGVEYDVVYPAESAQTPWFGADDAVRYIDEGLEACPDQKYAILGYSQGASAAAIALTNYTDTDSAGFKAIRAVLVVGNPFHIPGETNNVDNENGTSTRDCVGGFYNSTLNGGITPRRTTIPDIFYTSGKLLDICYQGDLICCASDPEANFLPNHVKYGSDPQVQRIGADFLISKLSADGSDDDNNDDNNDDDNDDATTSSTSTSATARPTTGSANPSAPTSPTNPGTPTPPSETSETAGIVTPSAYDGAASGLITNRVLALAMTLLTIMLI